MRNKRNVKGFTLVELIVVSAIMVAVMGAILNFIQPINRFYQRTIYNSDANDIGSYLMDKIEANTRYSTGLCVIEDMQGVPALKDGYILDGSGVKNSSITSTFTNVYIIDNEALRGIQESTYDATGTVAHRKQARGCILHTDINNEGIDFSKAQIVGTEDLYSDLGCTFTARLNTDDSRNKCLTIGMQIGQPQLRGTAYDYSKLIFSQERDLELVNINMTDANIRNMRAWYFSNDPAHGGTAYDINTIGRSNYTAGATAQGITDMISGAHRYTYILYNRNEPVTNENVQFKVSLYDKSPLDGGTEINFVNVKYGNKIPAEKITQFIDAAKSRAGSFTNIDGTVTTKTYDCVFCDGHGKIEDCAETAVMEDMIFYCKYLENTVTVTPTGAVNFYDIIQSNLNPTSFSGFGDTSYYTELLSSTPTYSASDPVDHKVTAPSTAIGSGFLDFQGWYSALNADGTGVAGTEFDDTADYTSSENFYAAYGPRCTIDPHRADASFIDGGVWFVFDATKNAQDVLNSSIFADRVASYVNDTTQVPPGKIVKWKVSDTSGDLGEASSSIGLVTDENYIFRAVLEDPPVPAPDIQVKDITPTVYWANQGNIKIDYKNEGSVPLDINTNPLSFELEFPNDIQGHNIGDNMGGWGDFPNGSSFTSVMTDHNKITFTISSTSTCEIDSSKTYYFFIQFNQDGSTFEAPTAINISY